MMPLICRCVFLLALVNVSGQVVGDFDISTGNFQFIYHKYQNLLLTIHNDACYFAFMDSVLHDDMLQRFQIELEGKITNVINTGDDSVLTQTTMTDMRNDFEDLLADHLCLGRDVFIIKIDYMACDFEQSTTCSWTSGQQVRAPWIIHSGETSTPLTGPEVDNTKKRPDGHYAYMEANDVNPGDVAELISPAVNVTRTDGLCLRFFANMYGRDVGRLEVYAKHGADNTTLWTLSGNQGKGWKVVEVSVPPTLTGDSGVKVVLRATRGADMYGDIAIDDISSTPGICLHSKLECSFEDENLCEWNQDGVFDDMDWTPHRGATPSRGTGPDTASHINGMNNTYYLYLEANDGHPQDLADLQSPLLVLKEPICLRFNYSMTGSGIGDLYVLTVDPRSLQESVLLSLEGEQQNNWHEAEVTVASPYPGAEIMVVFRAVRGRSSAGNIAIDHITSQAGPCGLFEGVPIVHMVG